MLLKFDSKGVVFDFFIVEWYLKKEMYLIYDIVCLWRLMEY